MCFNLFAILTGQGHIRKVLGLSDVSKRNLNIVFEVIPFETELFRHFRAVCIKLMNISPHLVELVNMNSFWGAAEPKGSSWVLNW